MLRRFSLIAVFLWLAALQGCVTPYSIPELPTSLGENGLLVARLYQPGSTLWENAQINIDGRLHNANLRDGYIAIDLSPGEHHFQELRIEGHHNLSSYQPESPIQKVARGVGVYRAPTYSYTPGTTVYYTTLSVNRRFTIEAGKITNLGLIVYVPADDPKKERASVGGSKQYYTVTLDNSAEMNRYLEVNYPALMATIADREFKRGSTNYFDMKKLPDLRRVIALYEVDSRKRIRNSTLTAVYGDVGTIVVYGRGADGKMSNLKVLDTGTLADIVDARVDGERFIFLTTEAKLLIYDQGKLAETKMPFPIHPVRMSSSRNGSLVIVDNRMRIFTSSDRGNSWTNYEGAVLEKARNDIGLVSDGEGIYVYLGKRGIPESILYVQPGESVPRAIARPENRQGVSTTNRNFVVARPAGLFILYVDSEFYFRPRNGDHWRLYSKPGPKCKPIQFDDTGRNLNIECEGKKYESKDSGRNWEKIEAEAKS